MNRIMIDIETLSNKPPEAKIATIGAAVFDSNKVIDTRYWRVDLSGPGEVAVETVAWWMRQSKKARVEIYSTDDRVKLTRALADLDDFIAGHDVKEFWARSPSFDLAILQHWYSHYWAPVPWQYWQERDHRTISEFIGVAKLEKPTHNALEDAVRQAEDVIYAGRLMKGD